MNFLMYGVWRNMQFRGLTIERGAWEVKEQVWGGQEPGRGMLSGYCADRERSVYPFAGKAFASIQIVTHLYKFIISNHCASTLSMQTG